MTEHPAVDETPPLYDEPEPESEQDWLEDDPEEAPARPRRKLLSPLPVTLFVILLVACGFLAGVEVEKGQSSSSTSGGFPAGLAGLRGQAAGGASKGSRTGPAGFPGAGTGGAPAGFSAGGLTAGEVTYVSGGTFYVTNTEGNTVKVKAPAGTTVTKTVSTSVHSVHPGDMVIVRGGQTKNGGVTADSISVSSSSGATNSTTGTGGSAQQLFGAG